MTRPRRTPRAEPAPTTGVEDLYASGPAGRGGITFGVASYRRADGEVLNDKAELTKILTYHVVGQKLAPEDLENGSFETLEKSKVTTSGSGESCTVDDKAKVVCGDARPRTPTCTSSTPC